MDLDLKFENSRCIPESAHERALLERAADQLLRDSGHKDLVVTNNERQIVSLDGLVERQAASEASDGGPIAIPRIYRLGTAPAPPTPRRHATEDDLIRASKDPAASVELIEKRKRLRQAEVSAKDPALSEGVVHRGVGTIKREIREIGSALYDLIGDNHIPNCDPLTWDCSFYEMAPADLVVAPIVTRIDLDLDSTLGIYSTTYNFEEMTAAIDRNELVEWWETRSPAQQRQLLSHYWSYQQELAAAAPEQRLVDLRDATQVDKALNWSNILETTAVWDVLWIGARRALSPIQWEIWELKMAGHPNREIREVVNTQFGTTYRENYISTIWHKQISAAIAEWFREIQEEIEALAEPERWKRCKGCGARKLGNAYNFMKRKQCSDGWAGICKECEKKKREEKKIIKMYQKEANKQ